MKNPVNIAKKGYNEILKIDELSRSLNNVEKELLQIKNQAQTLQQIIDSINALKVQQDQIAQEFKKIEKFNELYFYSIFKKPSESSIEAKKRFFQSLPQASGNLLLIQQGNSKLLKIFSEICSKNQIPYWASDGTLIGAVRHQGPIPWDDDIDVCMMRDDIHELDKVLSKTDYMINIVYDAINASKQLRFKTKDPQNPCFIDIFIYDYASDNNEHTWQDWIEKRNAILQHIRTTNDPLLSKWRDLILVNHRDHTELSRYLDDFYEKTYGDISGEVHTGGPGNVITATQAKKNPQKFQYIIDGLDTLSPISMPNSPRIYTKDTIFPTKTLVYDGIKIQVPNKYHEYLENMYDDYLELPHDIVSHFQHIDRNAIDTQVIKNFIKTKV